MKINVPLEYKKLPTNTELSESGMMQCIQEWVGPSFVYELFVHPEMLLEARSILRRLEVLPYASLNEGKPDVNPLRPHINIHTNSSLGRREWVIGARDILAGSPGVI